MYQTEKEPASRQAQSLLMLAEFNSVDVIYSNMVKRTGAKVR